MSSVPSSFTPSPSVVVTGPAGERAHRDLIGHLDVIERRFTAVRPGVWCFVGNGLSNQTFVEGPDGIVAIDTGECVEEMREAIRRLREHTDRPLVAVIYTHFHYVAGTLAVFDDAGGPVPVIGHRRIAVNRARIAGEIAPAYTRGLVQQFGTNLPTDGPDGLAHVGLGLFFRNPAHAPFTPGHVPATDTFDSEVTRTVAGLTVELTPAPSDADDSATLWFPELGLCVNNLVWPTLFNVFAIRGEEYRDPRVLLDGYDHLLGLAPEHLVGAHGPPLSGADEIARRVRQSRDAIQFLWDQTVRGINLGWTTGELADRVRLPAPFAGDYLTAERYGVVEHHVRQIHNGLRGWFDGDPAALFPLPPTERAERLIAGFGGAEVVRAQATDALASDDLRWAAELATWLVRRSDATADDRALLAGVLRAIGQRSPAANIRNWCLTTARDLEGTAPLDRFRVHRLRRAEVLADPVAAAATLRVLLVPERADGVDHHLALDFGGGVTCGLHVRNWIACLTDGSGADTTAHLDAAAWAAVLTGAASWAESVASGAVVVEGDVAAAAAVMACFDLPGASA